MKRKNRIRLFWGSIVMLAVLIISIQISNASEKENYIHITVHSGDTLWNIAQEYGDEGRDVRDTIDGIMKLNALSTSNIKVGQTLKVPQ